MEYIRVHVLLCNEEYMHSTSTNTIQYTPYSTVVCEDAEYSRVHSEYIDDTLEYYVLCKVR